MPRKKLQAQYLVRVIWNFFSSSFGSSAFLLGVRFFSSFFSRCGFTPSFSSTKPLQICHRMKKTSYSLFASRRSKIIARRSLQVFFILPLLCEKKTSTFRHAVDPSVLGNGWFNRSVVSLRPIQRSVGVERKPRW